MTTADTLRQYVEDKELSWPEIKTVTDDDLVDICPGISLTSLKNNWSVQVQNALSAFLSEQVAEFVQNTVAANQSLIWQFPNWTYEVNPLVETLTIYWNGKPVIMEEEE